MLRTDFQTVSVIGLGYIGLPTAAVIASRRVEVIGVDVDRETVETINRGSIHIVEPDLEMLVHASVTEGHLRATLRPELADAFLIAVPTPLTVGYQPDVACIRAAAVAIAPALRVGNLVVLESTSPVGTTEQLCDWLAVARPDLTFPHTHGEASDIRVAYCPERVLPGRILRELVSNDRVIGGITGKCSERAVALYRVFVEGECIVTNARTAEMCKLTENSFRDVNIAFANEISMICDELEIDARELISLANRHPRVDILRPGCGVGGHCIAVDPWFIVSSAPERAGLIRTARLTNDRKRDWVLQKIDHAIDEFLLLHPEKRITDVLVACLGTAFKPNIDDLRESPALHIVRKLSASHPGRVCVVEPHIGNLPPDMTHVPLVDLELALRDADIVVALVSHEAFRDFRRMVPPNAVVLDFVSAS